jgi:FemAB-related protein (PEP-CTERM system-associated)
MAPVIRELTGAQDDAWDRYVTAAPDGTFFHRAGWRDVVEGAFRQRAHYLFAEQDGAITGVLPLVHMRSRLFGNRLISVPFCVYGGPVASEPASAQALTDHATDLMNRLGAGIIEFRTLTPRVEGWATRSDVYATFRKSLAADPELNFKAIPRRRRELVRQAQKLGLQSRVDQDIDRFHRIFAESRRNLGTPMFSRRYLELLKERFGDCLEILSVVDDGEPISAILSFFFRDEVLPYHGGGTAQARRRVAADFMYWELIRRTAPRGPRVFDFSRAKYGSGSFTFKINWGFEPQPLQYQYLVRPGHVIPDHNPLNPKYHLMIETWKRLPLPVANLIGPSILRGIG